MSTEINIGDRVRVKSEPRFGVLVVRALFVMDTPEGHDLEHAECSTNGKKPGRSFRVDDLEIQP
jgi:hypothetical protein